MKQIPYDNDLNTLLIIDKYPYLSPFTKIAIKMHLDANTEAKIRSDLNLNLN